jgi:DNA-binding NtrC family response regulator
VREQNIIESFSNIENIPFPVTIADISANQKKILVVDDDPSLLGVLKNGLLLYGYHCETTASVATAFELVGKNSSDIMIVDIIMPDMSGLELTAKVKRIRPEMTIIVMTGHIEDFPYDRAIEAGASDFIKKPFSMKELIARIQYVNMQEKLLMREKELQKKIKELEEFYDIAVGRELRMVELKKEIDSLKKNLEACNKT